MKHSERIGTLMFRYIRNELSLKEKAELTFWRNVSPENDHFFREKTDPENIRLHFKRIYDSGDGVLEKLKMEFPDLFESKPKAKIRRLNKLLRYAAVLVITFGILWFIKPNPSVRPGSYLAMVISPEGTVDDLNSAWRDFKRGFHDGSAGIIRKTVNGQLIYLAPNEVRSAKDRYYTLFTDRGGEYVLQLADGTMIWVNASTTIRYPANISRDTIHVAIDGEAFFEIPDSVKHVYVVHSGFLTDHQPPTANRKPPTTNHQPSTINTLRSPDDVIRVTTRSAQFNVISYIDEPAVSISLISGTASVQLDSSEQSSSISLAAGEQMKLDSGKLHITQMAYKDDFLGWINSQTSFHDADLKTIMREVSRWYNVNISYEGTIPDKKYSLVISRDADIQDLLITLEKQGGHFTLHGKNITVKY